MTKINEDPIDLGIKAGVRCSIIKTFVKEGKKSKEKLGIRRVTLCKRPTTGEPLYAIRESEHPLSGDPKFVKYPISTTIQKVRKVNGIGLSVETETSVLLIQKID